ncbi:MAG: Urease accessory protein UreD [Pseudomonadota bacterium]|jgi:urease accessory protein
MSWNASLDLNYEFKDNKTLVKYSHSGPLRILKSLYPEGAAVCHNVLIHPPGGLVGGDTLEIDIKVHSNAHGLVTTPGATRFYRSKGEPAEQSMHAHLAPGARLEWLPMESIAYNLCSAKNKAVFHLEPGAEVLGWDVTALGLPSSNLPFEQGSFSQHLELSGVWREQACLDGTDHRLLDGALGLAGKRSLATLFFLSGQPIVPERRELALAQARSIMINHPLQMSSGATCLNPQVMLVRVLSDRVEPALNLLKALRASWRHSMWGMQAPAPRCWAT